jgi:flagellar hook-associated protein 3 FlgL
MRITNRMMVNNNINNLTGSMERLFELQKQAATRKKYLNASDNPSNNASVITLKSVLQTSEVYETTAQTTKDWMNASDFSLQQAGDVTQKAISAVMRGLSDTMGSESRATIAEEINGLLKEAVDIANTKHLDRYIFSGFTTDTKPFTEQYNDLTDPTKITGVSYKNNDPAAVAFQAIRRDIGPGETVTVNIDGYSTFQHMIDTLIDARDALAATTYNPQTLRDAATNLDDALNEVTLASTINGSRIRGLEGTQDRISQSNTEIKALISQKDEANIAEVTAELTNQENVYQTVVTISSRTQSMVNLFASLS